MAIQNKKILGGQTDPKGGFTYFVAPFLPEAFKAVKEKFRDKVDAIYKANADKSPADKSVARVVGTELSIDNEIQMEPITPPDPHEVIHILNTQAHKLTDISFMVTSPGREQGSKFQGFAVWLTQEPTIELAYVKVRAQVPNADHIMLAYNIPSAQGSYDDGEFYGDLQMVKQLKQKGTTNVAVFITRNKGQGNIGSKRFQIIHDIMEDLFKKMEENPCDPVDRGWSIWDGHEDTPIIGFPEGLDHTSASVAAQVEREREVATEEGSSLSTSDPDPVIGSSLGEPPTEGSDNEVDMQT